MYKIKNFTDNDDVKTLEEREVLSKSLSTKEI